MGSGTGLVLNLGFVDEGTGEVQTMNEANDSPIQEENKPVEDNTEPKPQTESQNSPSSEESNILTSEEESDVKIAPQKNEINEHAKEDKKLDLTENTIKETNTPKEKDKSEEKPKEKDIKPRITFGGTDPDGGNKGGNNNGDKTNAIGDQGNPKGDINEKALYGGMGSGGMGEGGSGGGASLDLAGWKWVKKPKVKDDNEDENGKIVFEITIDSEGEIISIKTIEKTVSPAVEKLYRAEVEKLSFQKTDNKIPASRSTGRITFIIRSN
jgi:hypothetical protein